MKKVAKHAGWFSILAFGQQSRHFFQVIGWWVDRIYKLNHSYRYHYFILKQSNGSGSFFLVIITQYIKLFYWWNHWLQALPWESPHRPELVSNHSECGVFFPEPSILFGVVHPHTCRKKVTSPVGSSNPINPSCTKYNPVVKLSNQGVF